MIEVLRWHDWPLVRDWVSAVATAGAAVFAWYAIRQSSRYANQSSDQIVAERRADYELNVLRDLVTAVTGNQTLQVQALLALTDARLPICRSAFGLADDEGFALLEAARNEAKRRRAESGDTDLPIYEMELRRERSLAEIAAVAKAIVAARPVVGAHGHRRNPL